MKILIISGGRTYTRYKLVYAALQAERADIRVLFQGGARGADTHAKNAAVLLKIPWKQLNADWEAFGRDAGLLRNERMLAEARALQSAYPDDTVELWAFRDDIFAPDPNTGGNGTLDMCARALRCGVAVRWCSKSLDYATLVWNDAGASVEVTSVPVPALN